MHPSKLAVAALAASTLSILTFPALGANLSFTTLPTVTTSTNITASGVTRKVFGPNSWRTTTDGIGCVVFPGTAPGNVCGSTGRFAGSAFISNPGPVTGGGNYVLMDGAPGVGPNSNTDTLYYSLGNLTAGQTYVVTFAQAAAQFVNSGQGPTTEQWLVSLDTGYLSNSTGPCDPTAVQVFNGCDSQQSPQMSAPGCPSLTCSSGSIPTDYSPWEVESLTFTASSGPELLGFFAEGGPGGAPPIDLLGDVSITAATPEPATYTFIGLAGMLALCIRLTKRR